MSELPFLVEHGPALWYAALTAFVVLGCLAVEWRWRRRARRERRQALAGFGAAATALDGAADGVELAVAGTLIVGDPPAAPMREGEPPSGVSAVELRLAGAAFARRTLRHAQRAPMLQLRVGGDLVDLEGPIELAAGAEERHAAKDFADETSAEVRAWLPAGLRQAAEACSPIFRLVCDGDRVVASGALHRGAGDGPGYRAEQTSWSLGPLVDEREPGAEARLRLVSSAALPRTGRPLWRRIARRAIAGALLFIAGTWIAGRWLSAPDSSVTRLQIASTVPLTRERALNGLEGAWASQREPDRASVLGAAAVRLKLGRCRQAAELLLDHQQFALAHDLGLSCGTAAARSIAARAALADGRYAEASELFDLDVRNYRAVEALVAHIAAHQWDRASEIIEHADIYRMRPLARACFAHALRVRAGREPPDAWQNLVPTLSGQKDEYDVRAARAQCQLLAADASPDDAVAAGILEDYDERFGWPTASVMMIGRGLPLATDRVAWMPQQDRVLLQWKPPHGFEEAPPALARAAADRLANRRGWESYRADLAITVAIATELVSPEETDAWWRLVRGNADAESDTEPRRAARAVLLALAIRRGARVVALQILADSPELASGLEDVLKRWLGLASPSDARDDQSERYWGPDWLVPGTAPAPVAHPQWARDPLYEPPTPYVALVRAGNLALLAERRGDASSAAELRARARRHYDAVMDLEIAVMLNLSFGR